jgi:hypothetical protein
VAVTLAFRPDLLKGAVTGSITATGPQPSPGHYAVAVLIDPANGQSYGINTNPVASGEPTAFEVPFSVTAIDPAAAYVIDAWIADAEGTGWEAAAGVPVITDGNPKSDVEITVDPVARPGPGAGAGSVARHQRPAPDHRDRCDRRPGRRRVHEGRGRPRPRRPDDPRGPDRVHPDAGGLTPVSIVAVIAALLAAGLHTFFWYLESIASATRRRGDGSDPQPGGRRHHPADGLQPGLLQPVSWRSASWWA